MPALTPTIIVGRNVERTASVKKASAIARKGLKDYSAM